MSHRLHLRLVTAAFAAAWLCGGAARAALPCEADLDRDGGVGDTDLLDLVGAWGTDPGGPPDFDGGGVGMTDLLSLLSNWGPIAFEFGPPLADPEAEQIGLEMLTFQGPLLLPLPVYERVRFDLQLIRATEPSLADEPHAPAWAPNQLIVGMIFPAPLEEIDCLNEVYQVTAIEQLFGTFYLLTFAGNLNVSALIDIYETAPMVEFAVPYDIIDEENTWTPTDMGGGVWQWQVDDQWCDCFDGCDCRRVWLFETDGQGGIRTIVRWEFGQPWCDFKNDSC